MTDELRETGELIEIYRAVGDTEYGVVMKNKKFTLDKKGVDIKYFGLDLNETIKFANKAFNRHVVAVLGIVVTKSILNKTGDFTNVDKTIFKSGTVEIHADDLREFNDAILTVIHKY